MKHICLFVFLFTNYYCMGQIWKSIGNGIGKPPPSFPVVNSLTVYNNELFAGGGFDTVDNYLAAFNIVKWNGNQLDSLQNDMFAYYILDERFYSPQVIYVMAVYNNELYVGGQSVSPTQFLFKGIARWNSKNNNWNNLGSGVGNNTAKVYAMTVYNNELYVGGNFYEMNGTNVNHIARYDGTQWRDVGGGVYGSLTQVRCMAVYKGELFVGGIFDFAGSGLAFNIARWNGSKWDSAGTGLDDSPMAMVVDSVKDVLFVGGIFGAAYDEQQPIANTTWIAQWDGSQWAGVGRLDTLIYAGITDLCFYRNELFAGLQDTFLGRWNGQQWSLMHLGGQGAAEALTVYGDELYVAGQGNIVGNRCIARLWLPPVGIEEDKKKETVEVQVYPTPTNGNIIVSYKIPILSKISFLKVYNLNGKVLQTYTLTGGYNKFLVDVSQLANGVYYYSIEIDGQIKENRKIVLVK